MFLLLCSTFSQPYVVSKLPPPSHTSVSMSEDSQHYKHWYAFVQPGFSFGRTQSSTFFYLSSLLPFPFPLSLCPANYCLNAASAFRSAVSFPAGLPIAIQFLMIFVLKLHLLGAIIRN